MAERIFIVEDNQEIVNPLEKGLSGWDFSTGACEDFHQVTEETLAFQPDLVLMDVNLPFFNGFYWTRRPSEKSRHSPSFSCLRATKMPIRLWP